MRRLAVLALGACAACVAATFTQTAPFARPSRPREQVELLGDGGTTHPVRAVGLLRTRSGAGYRAGLGSLLGEAGKHGCDAITDVQSAVAFEASTVGGTAEKTREDDFSATCLIYLDWVPDAGGPAPTQVLIPSPPTEPLPRPSAGTPD